MSDKTENLPLGYEISELPSDYTGRVWIEGQVQTLIRAYAVQSPAASPLAAQAAPAVPAHRLVKEWAKQNYVDFVSRSDGLRSTETISFAALERLAAAPTPAAQAPAQAPAAAQQTDAAQLAIDGLTERMLQLQALKKRADSMPVMTEWQALNALRNRLIAAPRPTKEQGDAAAQPPVQGSQP